jgi:F-type H+-transporting ATPase subunit b
MKQRQGLVLLRPRRWWLATVALGVFFWVSAAQASVSPEHIKELIAHHDHNGNGGIDASELLPVLEAMHEHADADHLKETFADIDTDRNGLLNVAELLAFAIRPNFWGWSMAKPPTGWAFVNFVIFVAGLFWLGRKPVKAAFQKRHETIKKAFGDAQAQHQRALAHHTEYRDKLASITAAEAELVTGARVDGAAERDRIIAAGKDYAERLRHDAVAAIEQERDAARRRLRRQVAGEVLREAEALVERQINDGDRQRLLEQAILDIENGSGDIGRALEAAGRAS